MDSFAIYMPVGGNDADVAAAADTIESAVAHSPALKWVVVVDDAPARRDLTPIARAAAGCTLIVLRNPRDGIGYGRTGGLCVADLVAFRHVQRETDATFVLKLDSDSLVIAPFARAVRAMLADHADAGLLGVVGDSFGENRTMRYARENDARMHGIASLPDSFAALTPADLRQLRPLGSFDDARYRDLMRARHLLSMATARGYTGGFYCQGGGYIVARRLLDAMAVADAFDDILFWRGLDIGEDLMISLWCAAVGLRLYDVSQTGPRFAIQPHCLPFSRQELASSPYTVIHSVRGHREMDVRTFFRERRARRAEIGALNGIPT